MYNVIEPQGIMVGRNDVTNKLYRLESKRDKAIELAAKELAVILGHTPQEFWSKTMPEELLNILNSFSASYSIAACKAYLQQHSQAVEFIANHVK